nr:hypothetical protein [Tanacetum cinerariifolium]
MQTQTSNTLHNAIMEADSKDRPPMLAPGNYVQWKSRIKRYIDTKPNHELIHHCLKTPPYKFTWADMEIPISEGSPVTRTESQMETYMTVSQDIRDQLNAEAEAVQNILTGIDNDIYSTVDACPNACEMWKAIERSQQAAIRNREKAIVNSPQSIYDQEPSMVAEDDETSKDKEIDKLMALISLSFKKIYKPTNNNLRTLSKTSRANQDNSLRINRSVGYENQRISNVAGVRETVGSTVDAAYHKEKMRLCKQVEAKIQLNAEQADWRDDTDDDEFEDQELEAHYMYMEKLQEVSPDDAGSGPIFDVKPLQKVSNDDHYNVFAIESEHPEQSKSVHNTYPIDQDAHNKEAQIKLYKTREDQELDKVISLEKKVKVLDNIVYKTGQSVQMMIMLNNKCRTNFAKPEFLKKAQRANPRLYDIGFYNDNLALMLAPESDEKRMDESIPWDKNCKSSIELFKIKSSVDMIIDGVERCKETIAKRTYFGHIDPFIKNTIEANFSQAIRRINAGLEQFHKCLNEEMVADLRYFNSLKLEVYSLISQLETQKTQFLNEIDRLSREYYYADHMNTILGVYTELDEVTNLQCKPTTFSNSFERKDFSKSKSVTQNNVSNDFSKPVTTQTLPSNKKSILKNTNVLAPGMYKLHTDHNQTRTSQLPQDSRKTNKRVSFSIGVISTTTVSRPQLKSNPIGDRVMCNNSQGKQQDVEDHSRNVKFSKNKMFVTACNDSLKDKTLYVNSVSAMCDKCVLNDKHDMCVLNSVAKPLKKTVASESNQKPRNITRKLYEHVSKTCSWWYPKFTPSRYKWKPKFGLENVNPNASMPLGIKSRTANVMDPMTSRCSKHMKGNLKLLINFVEKFLGTVKFRNDQIAPILGYGDLVQGAVTIKRVYYVEGLNHNLFSVSQFCDADLEVAFRKSTCYIRDLKGNDLLTDSRSTNLYSITLQDTNCPNSICLMAKATSSQAWLWHCRLSYLNFDTINSLSKSDIVVGLPKLKFVKDHLCSSCELGKAKRKSFHTKITLSSKRRLQLLHMDLCGPIRVASINGKRYVLVIVDDYSRYTWTYFLRSKDETPEVLIDFL